MPPFLFHCVFFLSDDACSTPPSLECSNLFFKNLVKHSHSLVSVIIIFVAGISILGIKNNILIIYSKQNI